MAQRRPQCATCRSTFPTFEEQRAHFQSDLHTFNLKRKIVNLVPVTQAQYEEKMRELAKAAKPNEGYEAHCNACSKTFRSGGSFASHLQSKKHKKKAAALAGTSQEPITTSHQDSAGAEPQQEQEKNDNASAAEAEEAQAPVEKTAEELIAEKIARGVKIEVTECLQCAEKSSTPEQNVEHMGRHHGLFIPDVEYLVDLEGMLKYMGEKLGIGNACLYCHKVFKNLNAVRSHMRDANHLKLAQSENGDDEDDEYVEFYDFSTSYAEAGAEGSVEAIEQEAAARIEVSADGSRLVFTDSGKSVGHRDYNRYYKQNLADPTQSLAVIQARRERAAGIAKSYKQLGWKGSMASQQRLAAKKAQQKQWHKSQKHRMQVGVKANKLMKYFLRQDLCF